MRFIVLVAALAACVPVDKGGDDGGVWFDDASVVCDPAASAWDDVFLFEAWTGGGALAGEVEVLDGGDSLDTLSLEEEDDEYWARESWADDLGTDCDAFYGLRFVFTATGPDGSEATAEAAG